MELKRTPSFSTILAGLTSIALTAGALAGTPTQLEELTRDTAPMAHPLPMLFNGELRAAPELTLTDFSMERVELLNHRFVSRLLVTVVNDSDHDWKVGSDHQVVLAHEGEASFLVTTSLKSLAAGASCTFTVALPAGWEPSSATASSLQIAIAPNDTAWRAGNPAVLGARAPQSFIAFPGHALAAR